VVREEVRVGKRVVRETERVGGEVRKEEVRIEREGDVEIHDRCTVQGAT
jgi:stress response protein YsnF